MRNTGTLSCLLLCFLILPRTSAQKSTQFALIDSLMSDYHSRGQFNGNILVAVRGDIIYHQSWGYADLDHHTPLDTSRIFCLASISKVFTATALMCLEEEGKVSLKDKVIQYLPELPEDPYGPVSVGQLLSHTSGLPEQPGGWQARIDQENGDVLEFLKKQETLDFEPGTRYAYSNNGFILLAEMVERLSGKSFGEFLEERLFKRAGMRDSYVRDKHIQAPAGLVKSYVRDQQADWPLHTCGPGGVYSTAGDLWRWDRAFFQGEIVKPATRDKMLRAIRVAGKEKN
jgi:CubicO group peptidase (beta-lactamase class C family)